jgi:methionine synthase I (cobalamin-dependent)
MEFTLENLLQKRILVLDGAMGNSDNIYKIASELF